MSRKHPEFNPQVIVNACIIYNNYEYNYYYLQLVLKNSISQLSPLITQQHCTREETMTHSRMKKKQIHSKIIILYYD